MSTKEIRQKLSDYIKVAEDKKTKAIYTIIEKDINDSNEVWTDEFVQELNKRTADFETGNVKGISWTEVKEQATKSVKNAEVKWHFR